MEYIIFAQYADGAAAKRTRGFHQSCHEPPIRKRSHEGRHGRHHNRAEPHDRAFEDGIDRRFPFVSFGFGYCQQLSMVSPELAVTALQMTTINVAEHFGIDHLVGGIGPGKYADMILLPDLNTVSPDLVISCGNVVSENGRMTVSPRLHSFLPESKNTIRLSAAFSAADFKISAPPEQPEMDVRVIDMVTDLVTGEKIVAVPVNNGEIGISVSRDLLKISAVDRTHGSERMFTGLIHGWELKTGALASSAAWDTTDIIVVGADEADMALAVNRIIELQGGAVLCAGGKIVLELALLIFGLITQAPMAQTDGPMTGPSG
jgi:adenine deaminase